MDRWLITFFLGALLSLFFPIVPTLFYLILCIALCFLLFLSSKTRKCCAFVFGAAWMLLHGMYYQQGIEQLTTLLAEQQSKKMLITGTVETIPQQTDTSQRFNFIISAINDQRLASKIKVRLSWKTLKKTVLQGQVWQLSARLKPAHGLANVGSFSYQTWLRKNHLHATGYVVESNDNKLFENSITFRQRLYQQINTQMPEHFLSPLILALTFGERGKLTKQHWQVLQNTATQHLIAISGLHLGLVAGGSFLLLSLLMRFIPLSLLLPVRQQQFLSHFNNKTVVIALTFLITLAFAYLAGFSVPTIRALLMMLIFWLMRFLTVKLSCTRWLLLALCLITLLTPFSLFSTSFWLSFYAVSIIFILLWRFQHIFNMTAETQESLWKKCKSKSRRWFYSLFYLQLGLIALMLPMTIPMNHQLSLMALPANLIAVPWMTLTTIPLSLLSVFLLPINENISQVLLDAAIQSLTLLWVWLQYLSDFSAANISVSASEWLFALVVIILLVSWSVLGLSLRSRLVIPIVFASLLTGGAIYYVDEDIKKKPWQVNVMDVGQGLSVVIEANNQALVYDTGASFPSGFSMADSVVIPYLKNQGYHYIDLLMISHDDNDHAGGLALLTQLFSINQLIYNHPLGNRACLAGDIIDWQFLTIEVFAPQVEIASHNNDSCVVKITDGNRSVLLTGDISAKVEKRLIAEYSSSGQLSVDVLVVPHHGSKTSSSTAFIEEVSPQYAIFSAGFLNRWRMPVESVVNRYHQAGVTTFNTAISGMIQIEMSAEPLKVKTQRTNFWPFWFAN